MSKKILVLTASPRKEGNSNKMADAFIAGAKAAGHEVAKFETAQMEIGGCRACDACWSDGTACVYEDDFDILEPYLESHDVIVFATPIYWYSFPAQVKGIIDRFYAYGGAGGSRSMHIMESVMLVCGEETDEDAYDAIRFAYRMMGRFLGWTNRGMLVAGGLRSAGAVEKTPFLEKAEELGRAL